MAPTDGPRMRPLTRLLAFDEAYRSVLDACAPVDGTERVPLSDLAGRVLAEDLTSPIDVPGFDRAAMDGYAVRAEDTQGASEPHPRRLRIAGVAHAERTGALTVRPGDCVQIATGAAMPPGADGVVMVERTRLEGGDLLVPRPVSPQEHVSLRGSDIRKGSLVLRTGSVMTPPRVAVAAAVGSTTLEVHRRPQVALFSSGSELREPGHRLEPGQIYNSNAPALRALFLQHGADVTVGEILPDEVGAMVKQLKAHQRHDLIVVSGGSSVGERDLLQDAVRALGQVTFHGVQVKPGKPLLLGQAGRVPLVGLPGYPASCLCDAYLFLVPALRRMSHLPPQPLRRIPATLASPITNTSGRHFFYPVKVEGGRAVPTYTESGATTSVSEADGYVEIPATTNTLDEGQTVEVTLF